MYQKILMITIVFAIFLDNGVAFSGIRCGNDIISVGDTKTIVASKIQSCGQIIDKDSYIKETENSSEENSIKIQKKIDLWSVRIQERGSHYCYPLTFEDGILIDIGSWDRCN